MGLFSGFRQSVGRFCPVVPRMDWRNRISFGSFPNLRVFFLGRTNEVVLGTHTIKSDGARVARDHLSDWLILLLLVVIEIILIVIHPFRRFVGKDMMEDLKYPLKENTVPVWAVPMYAVLLPIVIFLIFYLRRRDVYDLHHSVLGLLFAVLITAVLTDAIKDAVGRPRPDFFWRCFPDGIDKYDRWGNVICHGKGSVIKEGHKSFPSGHTSWSFAGLGFLSVYLSGKLKAFDQRGHVAKLCIVFLPLLIAALVGVSRVDDYWHHWQDVFAGGLLGLVVAVFCYLQFFPPPNRDNGWGPYAYFLALEQANMNSQPGCPVNESNAPVAGGQVVDQQTGQRNGASVEHHNPSLSVADIESGRRTNKASMLGWVIVHLW
ncbi:lipid phosphate phosphatase 2-like isoform X2 [Diospyros lotus]|uniref:lipid phosphate phosphatase 2-like isoform X2 n=1 Tax=Diospyros lotus TaxID=55363 RepID=UPI00224E48B9|nr:lipid phosphate phosphatase 2-like isoform X2 [Diospyros lotus]